MLYGHLAKTEDFYPSRLQAIGCILHQDFNLNK